MKKKGLLALFLCLSMLSLTACGKKEPETGKENTQNQEKAMGRYIEEAYPLPEGVKAVLCMEKTQDGALKLYDTNMGVYTSEDGGKTWEPEDAPWLAELADAYVSGAAMAPDGTFLIHCLDYTDPEGNDMVSTLYRTRADGTMEKIYGGEADSPIFSRVEFMENGKAYASDMGGTIYEIEPETGAVKELGQAEGGYVEEMDALGENLYLVTYEGVECMSMSTGEVQEADEALSDFIRQITQKDSVFGMSTQIKRFVLDVNEEENLIYLACENGLYRHVAGGDLLEQVIDGSLNTFSDPSTGIVNMLAMDNEEFLVLYLDGKLMHYAFDASVPTVPENQITVYSLYDNSQVQQAITLFQNANPDTYVKLQTGMTGEDGITESDALRTLNTEILAGNGPDVLLLDGMPVESYMEKGLLADISGILETYGSDAFFETMMKTYEQDGGIYALPTAFSIPMVAGDKTALEGITDLSTLADAAERIREEKTDGTVFGKYLVENLARPLLNVSVPAWKNADGTMNTEKITEFVTQINRILQAEQAGLTPEEIEERSNVEFASTGLSPQEARAYGAGITSEILDFYSGSASLLYGMVNNVFSEFHMLTSGLGDTDSFHPLQGQAQHVFVPKNVLGINAKSGNLETAEKFIETMLSEEVQKSNSTEVLPVHRGAFDAALVNPTPESDMIAGLGATNDDGESVMLEIYWSTEEELQAFREYVEALDTPYLQDYVLEDMILEPLQELEKGEKSVDETVSEITKKISLYEAE